MADFTEYRKIYRAILDATENSPKDRKQIIDFCIGKFDLSQEELQDDSTNARKNILRSRIGAVINDMHAKGVISRRGDGFYEQNTQKPIALRVELCEEKLLEILNDGKRHTKNEIRESLIKLFKTDSTATQKDDNQLYTYIGQILKRLAGENIIRYEDGVYYISEAMRAKTKNRQEVLSLCGEFLSKIHAKGGEFFEHYFMNLIEKYLMRTGKTVIKSTVTGGADDGGIDGICETVDSLGFREIIMVQTKNRSLPVSETDVRGFYGAVCARQGSRGIFATTSEFHPVARDFLLGIDNCVGVDGKKIFSMAVDSEYGIKRINQNELIIDETVIY